LYLAARDETEAVRIADDTRIKTAATVFAGWFDAANLSHHESFMRAAATQLGGLDGIVLCFGTLGDNEIAERDPQKAVALINENFAGAVSLLTIAANHLEAQQSGFAIVLGSVAGERGRRTNYVYGSAKGALALFTQGMRARLAKSGVQVMTVKLGQVDTRMTFGRPRMAAVAQPEKVARKIYDAWRRKADVVYVPGLWRPIMAAVRAIPERFFKRLEI
jgi:short-subunit dehydrogenase